MIHSNLYSISYARNIEANYKWFLLKCEKMDEQDFSIEGLTDLFCSDDCVPLSSVTMMWLSPPDPSGSVLM